MLRWRKAHSSKARAAALPRDPRRLLRDTQGGPMMEYAFVGPPAIALLLAVLNTALIAMAGQGLETAAESAARLVMTGQAQGQALTAATFKTAACKSLPQFMGGGAGNTAGCPNLYVNVTTVSAFANATAAAPTFTYNNGNVANSFQYSTGTQGAIVVLQLMYLWPTPTGAFGLNMSNQPGGNRLILATSVLKTEGY